MFAFASASFVPFGSVATPIQGLASPIGVAPSAFRRAKHNGLLNKGSPLYIPPGVPVEFAIPPPIHQIPDHTDVDECSVVAAPSSRSSTPDLSQYDGLLNEASPLFIPPEAADLQFAGHSAVASSSSPASSSSDGVLNLQPPLFVAPGLKYIPAAAFPSAAGIPVVPAAKPEPAVATKPNTDGALNIQPPLFVAPGLEYIPAALPSASSAQPTPEAKPEPAADPKPSEPNSNGVLNVAAPLFVPSAAEQKKTQEERERRFWEHYWAKEQRRLQIVAASVFPEPLPKPVEVGDEEEGRRVIPKRRENKPDYSQWKALVESVADFIGI